MYGRQEISGRIVIGLPTNGKLMNSSTVSGHNQLDEDVLLAEG